MMKEPMELLKELTQAWGVAGREKNIRAIFSGSNLEPETAFVANEMPDDEDDEEDFDLDV